LAAKHNSLTAAIGIRIAAKKEDSNETEDKKTEM
jgi:hypothetical protein